MSIASGEFICQLSNGIERDIDEFILRRGVFLQYLWNTLIRHAMIHIFQLTFREK